MKYIKTFENINLDDWDYYERINIGDKFIVTKKLYVKYPHWSLFFKKHINKKTVFEVSRLMFIPIDHLECIDIKDYDHYLPYDEDIIEIVH